MPMSKFRKALRLSEKANKHYFHNIGNRKVEDDEYFKFETIAMCKKEKKMNYSHNKRPKLLTK